MRNASLQRFPFKVFSSDLGFKEKEGYEAVSDCSCDGKSLEFGSIRADWRTSQWLSQYQHQRSGWADKRERKFQQLRRCWGQCSPARIKCERRQRKFRH